MIPAHLIPLVRCNVLLAAVPLLAACATNPVTGESDFVLMSEEQEISLGRQANTRILKETPVYEDPKLQQLVQQVGEELASHSHRPELFYRFTVLDSTAINAFALPGGYIGVHTGLIEATRSEDELAGVLAHEVAHVTQRHIARALHANSRQNILTTAMMLGAIIISIVSWFLSQFLNDDD